MSQGFRARDPWSLRCGMSLHNIGATMRPWPSFRTQRCPSCTAQPFSFSGVVGFVGSPSKHKKSSPQNPEANKLPTLNPSGPEHAPDHFRSLRAEAAEGQGCVLGRRLNPTRSTCPANRLRCWCRHAYRMSCLAEDQAPFPPTSSTPYTDRSFYFATLVIRLDIPTRYDPDAEWQFSNMTPKQKECAQVKAWASLKLVGLEEPSACRCMAPAKVVV